MRRKITNGSTKLQWNMGWLPLWPPAHCMPPAKPIISTQHHAKVNGSGHHYLIQHSAGSGKSNSIAWLVHQLAFVDSQIEEGRKAFIGNFGKAYWAWAYGLKTGEPSPGWFGF
ncbi:MAG: hypothetical protein HC889_12755 [Synechococcaceae cyanobacterium SM1_2_3]|nr:hypothetical protein [Synechococcaceae cyanobacterium SM1_2_3]